MIHIKDHNQGVFFDPWSYLGDKRRKLLNESWAGLFQEHILRILPVDKLYPFFKEDFGRPTKELHTMLGTLILQQMHDLTDNETTSQLAFNLQWHYALNIPEESDQYKYICPKTLWNVHKIVTDNELDRIIFNGITDKLAHAFDVDTTKQRLDSVHIQSNMRHLGRIGIISKTIQKFLVNLKRQHKNLFDDLDQSIIDKYLPKKALSCFSMVKPSDAAKTLQKVCFDLYDLAQHFSDHQEVPKMSSYHLLLRVLEEQCVIEESDDDNQPPKVSPKAPKQISSSSVQNPSDPDAGYDGHKGKGYQVQVMETYCDDEEEKERSKSLNLITYVETEPANESDANALLPALESTKERELAPKELECDSLYGSDENVEAAKTIGVETVAPTMGAPTQKPITLTDFTFSEEDEVVSCPKGHTPIKTKTKRNRHSVAFNSEHCANCPLLNDCPVTPGKKNYYLRYKDKDLRIAKRKAEEKTDEFKERYRWRAGVEATMSEYDRRTGVKQLRVRGLKAVRFCATLKAIGINIFRATAVTKALAKANGTDTSTESAFHHVIYVVKEHFEAYMLQIKYFFRSLEQNDEPEGKMAA